MQHSHHHHHQQRQQQRFPPPPAHDQHLHRGEVQSTSRKLDYNSYATKKTVASSLLIISVITNNVLMLKNLLQRPSNNKFYWPLISMLVASLSLLLIIGAFAAWLGKTNIKDKVKQRSANILNNSVAVLSMLVLLLNITVSAFEMGELYSHGFVPSSLNEFSAGYEGDAVGDMDGDGPFGEQPMIQRRGMVIGGIN